MKKIAYPVAILAGGLATRMRPATLQTPKSLLMVNGQPFIFHQLQLLRRQQVSQVVLCLGFLGKQIQDYVGDGSQLGLHVQYCFDGSMLLGTAGALKQALPQLDENFFVMYGDSYLLCDFKQVQSAYQRQKKPALMTVYHNNNQWDKSNVEYRQGKILDYNKEKITKKMRHIDYGLGILNSDVFSNIPDNLPYDLELLYQNLLGKNLLAAYEVEDRFYEIGSVSGLEECRSYLFNP